MLSSSSAGSLPLLKKLRGLLSGAHKKTYTLSVGKLNPAKLANFSEVECFVLVACGENSLVDSKVRSHLHSSRHSLFLQIHYSPPRWERTPRTRSPPTEFAPSLPPTSALSRGRLLWRPLSRGGRSTQAVPLVPLESRALRGLFSPSSASPSLTMESWKEEGFTFAPTQPAFLSQFLPPSPSTTPFLPRPFPPPPYRC